MPSHRCFFDHVSHQPNITEPTARTMYSSRGSNAFGQQSYAAQSAVYGASRQWSKGYRKREKMLLICLGLSLMISGMLLCFMLLLVG
ncbi:hypothetical protein RGQ29_029915 [Quercus rubra]|uniref:Uncharacterized protein n=1 Tax=Quercus rubra TaxID=3512 RepID=A0AAN7EG73_QUERU|nr:hypothetical protein RGQ29_029915 [Quercus rubra]